MKTAKNKSDKFNQNRLIELWDAINEKPLVESEKMPDEEVRAAQVPWDKIRELKQENELLKKANQEMKDALESALVFVSPLERLKNWNEYKEDAAKRILKALNR